MNNTRYDYSPIIRREPLRWPNGARVAVWVIPNIEHFHAGPPRHRPTAGSTSQVPDVYNMAWRDYGLRVGIWRQMAMLDKYGIRATVALNAEVCDHYPVVVEEGLKRGWEYMGHGLTNSQGMYGLPEDEERAVVQGTVERIAPVYRPAAARLARPGPGRDGAHAGTPDRGRTSSTSAIGAPTTSHFRCTWRRPADGDAVHVGAERHPEFSAVHHTGQQFYETSATSSTCSYADGEATGRVMAIALHPMITGQPHRAKYLDQALGYVTGHRHVWLATGSRSSMPIWAKRAGCGT